MTTDAYASWQASIPGDKSRGTMVKTWKNCVWKLLYLTCIM